VVTKEATAARLRIDVALGTPCFYACDQSDALLAGFNLLVQKMFCIVMYDSLFSDDSILVQS